MPIRTFVAIVAVTLLSSCSSGELPPTGEARIKLDDRLNLMHTKDTAAAPISIAPCAALVVEQEGYTFKVPAHASDPNAVHLYEANDGAKYRADWKIGQTVSLDSTSLKRLDGEGQFDGFRPGKRFILAIGHDKMPIPAGSKIEFSPMWMSGIEVAADGS